MHEPSLPDRSVDGYTGIVEPGQIRRLRAQAKTLERHRVLHINSTATGGGVAELLRSIVPLCNDLGVDTNWCVMDATDEFFDVTKAMHNGLQGSGPPLTEAMKHTYRTVNDRNASDLDDEYSVVIVHDPQPLGMLEHIRQQIPEAAIVWRCHIDLTDPIPEYLSFATSFLSNVDRTIFSRSAYASALEAELTNTVIHPAIDPLTEKNRRLDGETISGEFDRFDPLNFEKPVVAQVSRFDPWKDQFGTLEAYRLAKQDVADLQLALSGGMAGDDPEGLECYERVAAEAAEDPDVHVLTDLPDRSVNALQRCSDVVIQKSLREGFGLVVAEALWKRTPVIGSNVGGIPLQIVDGRTGYLVDREDTTAVANHAVALLSDDDRRRRFGEDAREHIRERFLLPRQVIDLFDVVIDLTEPD